MNDSLIVFKAFLFSRKYTKATVKNYIADTSRFIKWYEDKFNKVFQPSQTNSYIIKSYLEEGFINNKASSHALSARSIDRHHASLKKFFNFLSDERIIERNPLSEDSAVNLRPLLKEKAAVPSLDPLLREFKDYLYRQSCTTATIKNYLLDIQHLINYLKAINSQNELPVNQNILYKLLSTEVIESYKNHLLDKIHFSPVSVNRKLSSIRRFILWLYKEGKIDDTKILDLQSFQNIQRTSTQNDNLINPQPPTIPESPTFSKKKKKWSFFGPIRLINFFRLGLVSIFDILFILPIVGLFQKIQSLFLLIQGISVFQSLTNTKLLKKGIALDNVIIEGIAGDKAQIGYKTILTAPKNISKFIYAPLEISVKSLPLHKRFIHTLRYKRPDWYRKYHEHRIAHYLHFALLLIFIGILVFWIQYHVFSPQGSVGPVFASVPLSPPRFLSFKGRLSDKLNNSVTEETNLRFSLYNDDTASGSALLWQEVLSVTPDNKGKFITLLGRNNYIPESTFSENPELFIGVTRETDPEMNPRQRVATTGLSENAEAVGGLRPITQSNDSANSLLALDSAGNLSIGGQVDTVFQATDGSFSLQGDTLYLSTNAGTDSSIVLSPDGIGMIDLQKPLQNTTENNNYLEAPGSVEVNDTFAILATSSAVAALNIRQDNIGNLISASSSGTAKFTLDYLGNAMFSGSLAINGGSMTTTDSTFRFLPDNVINLYIGENATDLTIGATSGNTTIRNNFIVNGSTTLGQGTDDQIFFNGSIASNLIASESGRFDLGRADRTFNNAYLTNLFLSPSATTGGFLKRESNAISLLNSSDAFLIGGNSIDNALIKLAGGAGQDSFLNAGSLGIGTTSTLTDKLQVFGDVRIGTLGSNGCLKRYDGTALAGTCSSDERLKKDIQPIENVLDKLAKLRPVTFSMRKEEFPEYGFGEGTSYGLIAQEVEKIFPDLVEIDQNGYKMVKYGPELSMLTLAAVSELNSEVQKLKDVYPVDDKGDIYIVYEADTGYAVKNQKGENLSNLFSVGKIITGTLRSGLLTAREGLIDSLAVTSDKFFIAGLTLKEYILQTIEESPITTPTLVAKSVKSDFISPLTSDSLIAVSLENSEFSILNSQSTSGSAVARFDREGNATLSGTLQAQNILSQDASISGNLRAGKIIATEIEGLDDKLATLAASLNNSSNSANITNIYNIYNNASESAINIQQPTPTPAISPTLLAENPSVTSNSGELNSLPAGETGQLLTDFIPLASYSAALSYVPNLSTDFQTIHQGLMVLGYTSVVDLSAADRVSIGGSFILAENSINVLGADLDIQPLKQGNIKFMAGLMTLDTKGNLEVLGNARFAKDVSIEGKLSANLIAPVPGSDLIIQLPSGEEVGSIESTTDSQGYSIASLQNDKLGKLIVKNSSNSAILSVNNVGDVIASGAASFRDIAAASLNIIRGASADTSAIDTVASGSAGIGTITRGYTTRTIYSPYVTENSLIYITPRSAPIQSGSQITTSVPYLSRQVPEDPNYNIKGSFTVQIPVITSEEVQFNWWIIN